ncbi:Glucokinase [Aquimixticola soesokkakensis]|uniref:Glucokinase n=1 Tax=Aquimixticola soesokkakensis TaxID=1519096 RepID=A0A1Y5TI08_9RHOB|nr:ROK family protein [Aquimixticola soesokkakensis]SLN64754.1 Glucokinase [Aquimixticola soesokkakensis]
MPSHPANTLTLVADVGGTNTRVALADGTRVLAQSVRKYANADHSDLQSVIRAYIADEGGVDCLGACVAIAGPVMDGVGKMTNLDWTFDRDSLRAATGAEHVSILNDLQAQGHAIGYLSEDKLRVIIDGPSGKEHAAKLVIGVGTGFNAAPVFDTEAGRFVAPSECGHTALPVGSERLNRLAAFIAAEHGFASVEEVLSGRGMENIYRWVSTEAGTPAKLAAADIGAAAKSGDPLAVITLETFAQVLGAVAGDLALTQLPYGGVYLIGGVARAITPWLQGDNFAKPFQDKGRFSTFMRDFGVKIVEDDFAALVGCASHIAHKTHG